MSPNDCPPGKIMREGYTAKRSSTGKTYKVKKACVEDIGKPGKTPASQRIKASADTDSLEEYGYVSLPSMNEKQRQIILEKAINSISRKKKLSKHDAAVKVMRHLNLLYVYTKNTNEEVNKILHRDRDWVGMTYLGKDYAAKM